MLELLTKGNFLSKGPNFAKLATEMIYVSFIPIEALIPFRNCSYLSHFACFSVSQLWSSVPDLT